MGFAVFLSAGRPRRPRSGRMQSIQVIVMKIKRLAYRLIGLACAAGRTRKVRQRYCRPFPDYGAAISR
jgi:hypothetical protein